MNIQISGLKKSSRTKPVMTPGNRTPWWRPVRYFEGLVSPGAQRVEVQVYPEAGRAFLVLSETILEVEPPEGGWKEWIRRYDKAVEVYAALRETDASVRVWEGIECPPDPPMSGRPLAKWAALIAGVEPASISFS